MQCLFGRNILKFMAVLLLLLIAAPVSAQDSVAPEQDTLQVAPVADSASAPGAASEPSLNAGPTAQAEAPPVYEGGINPNEINPIVFSYWERAAINDVRNSSGATRGLSDEEAARLLKASPTGPKQKPPPEEREIKLGGIVFVSGEEWAIWLNGKRVTPSAIPHEVIDLKVYKEYVEMKWFDDYTNQIFPLRLRAHERFNIDTRIFLPG